MRSLMDCFREIWPDVVVALKVLHGVEDADTRPFMSFATEPETRQWKRMLLNVWALGLILTYPVYVLMCWIFESPLNCVATIFAALVIISPKGAAIILTRVAEGIMLLERCCG